MYAFITIRVILYIIEVYFINFSLCLFIFIYLIIFIIFLNCFELLNYIFCVSPNTDLRCRDQCASGLAELVVDIATLNHVCAPYPTFLASPMIRGMGQ